MSNQDDTAADIDAGASRPLTDLVGLYPDITDGLSTDEYLTSQWCKRYDDCATLRDKVLALCWYEDGEERDEVPVDEIFDLLLGRWTHEELQAAKARARARFDRLKPLMEDPSGGPS